MCSFGAKNGLQLPKKASEILSCINKSTVSITRGIIGTLLGTLAEASLSGLL